MTEKVKRKFVIPHTFTIIFLLIVLMAILTWIVPSGEFAREEIDGRSVVIPGTYQSVDSNPQGFVDVFKAPIDGFIDSAEVVGFVLIVGGAFGIVNKTGAIESGIGAVISRFKGKEMLIIPISMILFSLGGTTFGMAEETLPFYMIFVPLMTSLGYDALVAIAIVFIGAASGAAASTINPFSVGIAQALAQLAPGSGIGFRVIMYIIILIISIAFVMMYAKRVKNDPKSSLVYDVSRDHAAAVAEEEAEIRKFTGKEAGVLIIFAVGMGIMVYGVIVTGWYIPEIAMCFAAIGVLSGLVARLSQEDIANSFIAGAGELVSAALAIALARGIVIVAQNGFIIDTILNSASGFLGRLPKVIFIYLTFFLESALAFLIPSSSGLASLTVPVLAPLGDLVNISSQVIVTAYQFGVGLTNFITPTSGVLMGALAVAEVPFAKWVKFIVPLLVILIIAVLIFLTAGIYIGF
ncbi:putative basic amino acid antiporter YfcC [Romboutsia weinsteinii]|uniref:Putative basic amino acid antiporter YfcC n=1 Tax=Romboutsia weinsteinii TaxID=2020949 RepID=A0A371J8D6_9FIRM|nr:YfcC family protein [Romboutsia weinsteinii]RDY29041.1 putative basic amino acid antiporter YfcC [Romboutsia weinsteinii]